MKYLFLSFVLAITVTKCLSQKVAVMAERNNEIYVGIDNPISIAVENTACKSLIVKASKGVIKGSSGNYIFRGSEVGPVKISVFTKNGGRLKQIGSHFFRLKLLWDPTPFIGGSNGGEIQKKYIIGQGGLHAKLLNSEFQVNVKIDSFRISIIHNDTCSYKLLFNNGNIFSNEVKAALDSLKEGDTVVIKDIYVQYFNYKRLLQPMIFTIIE